MGKIKLIRIAVILIISTISYGQTETGLENLKSRIVSLEGGVNLHYVTQGEGDVVVLLHGFPQTWLTWKKVIPALSKSHKVIALDMRGAGDSFTPQDGFDKKTMASDVKKLLDYLNIEKATVIGHDIGGMVAYAFAHEYPKQTNGIGIIDVPLPGIEPLWSMIMSNPMSWHFRFQAAEDIPEMLVYGKEDVYINHFIDGFAGNKKAISTEERKTYIEKFKKPGVARSHFDYYRAMEQDIVDNKKYAKTILKIPVLALSAGQPYELQLMKSLATNVQGGVIENSGHWIPEEQPELLIKAIKSFLKDI